jgi:mono/diheme cytochrome c family protein
MRVIFGVTAGALVGALFVALVGLLVGGAASAQDRAQIEAGETLYDEHCATCHGEKLRSAGAMPDLRRLGAGDRPRFDQAVLDGRGQMPAWRGVLNAQELDALWAYIGSRATR